MKKYFIAIFLMGDYTMTASKKPTHYLWGVTIYSMDELDFNKINSYSDTYNLPREKCTVTGQFSIKGLNNCKVSIYPDVKSGHHKQSPHPLDDHPTIYWSIPHAIVAGQHIPSATQAIGSWTSGEEGHIEIYRVDDFFENINLGNSGLKWAQSWPHYSLVVPVFYPLDGGENTARSFLIIPERRGIDG